MGSPKVSPMSPKLEMGLTMPMGPSLGKKMEKKKKAPKEMTRARKHEGAQNEALGPPNTPKAMTSL